MPEPSVLATLAGQTKTTSQQTTTTNNPSLASAQTPITNPANNGACVKSDITTIQNAVSGVATKVDSCAKETDIDKLQATFNQTPGITWGILVLLILTIVLLIVAIILLVKFRKQ